MSVISQISAKIHLGFLELATIIFVAASFYISYTEADMLSLYETMLLLGSVAMSNAQATNVPLQELEYGTGMVLRNAIVPWIGSFAAMLIPVLVYKAKSPFSLSGQKVDVLEKVVIFAMFAVAMMMPFVMWNILDHALNTLLLNKKIDTTFYDYRMFKQKWTIFANIIVELFIGLMSIYEIVKGPSNESKSTNNGKSKTNDKGDISNSADLKLSKTPNVGGGNSKFTSITNTGNNPTKDTKVPMVVKKDNADEEADDTAGKK